MADNFVPYGDQVRETVIGSLVNGKSVLQKDREGIDYAQNPMSGTVYQGINLLYLQQVRENNGYKSPNFATFSNIESSNAMVSRRPDATVEYYHAQGVHYQKNVYDESGAVLHAKGDPVLDANGQNPPRSTYTNVWNYESVETVSRKVTINKNDPSYPAESYATNPFDKNPALMPHTMDIKPSDVYKAKDNTPLERLAEAASKYMNSCYTGEKYKATEFTRNDVRDILKTCEHSNAPILKALSTAGYHASGAARRAEERKNSNSNTQSNEQSQEQTRSKGKGR